MPANENITKVYQLVAVSKPDVGQLALTIRSKEIFADLADANRFKKEFHAQCLKHAMDNRVAVGNGFEISFAELELHQ